MNIIYKKSLIKDLKSVNHSKTKEKIAEIVAEIKNAESISEVKNIKKLQGYPNAYRIRLGDYRIGFLIEDEKVVLCRILKRNDIYKVFP